MKVDIVFKNSIQCEVKETETFGEYAYLVALLCGGLMEDSDFHYTDYQIIRANSEEEALEKYNKLNNCSFYWGHVIGKVCSTEDSAHRVEISDDAMFHYNSIKELYKSNKVMTF